MNLLCLILVAFNIAATPLAEAEVFEHLWNNHFNSEGHSHDGSHHHHSDSHHEHQNSSEKHNSNDHDHQIADFNGIFIHGQAKIKKSKLITNIIFYHQDIRQKILVNNRQNILGLKKFTIIPPPGEFHNLPLLI